MPPPFGEWPFGDEALGSAPGRTLGAAAFNPVLDSYPAETGHVARVTAESNEAVVRAVFFALQRLFHPDHPRVPLQGCLNTLITAHLNAAFQHLTAKMAPDAASSDSASLESADEAAQRAVYLITFSFP